MTTPSRPVEGTNPPYPAGRGHVARLDEPGGDADGVVVQREAGPHGVEPRVRLVEQGGARRVELRHAPAGHLAELPRLRDGRRVAHRLVARAGAEDGLDFLRRDAEPALAGVDGQHGPGLAEQRRALGRPHGGADVAGEVVVGVVGRAEHRDRRLAGVDAVVEERLRGVEDVERLREVGERFDDPPGAQPVRVGLDHGDDADAGAAPDRLGVGAHAGEVDRDGGAADAAHRGALKSGPGGLSNR